MPITYRYTDLEGNPILSCPNCDCDWTLDQGIELVVSINGHVLNEEIYTIIDGENGLLVDVDRLVANGYHSETRCGGCGEKLSEMEEVVEMRDDDELNARIVAESREGYGIS